MNHSERLVPPNRMNNGFLPNVKRTMLRSIDLFSFFSIFCVLALPAKDTFSPYTRADEVPQSATALWKSYDSKAEPLEVKVHHEWKEGGMVSRLVSFKVGTFKGAGARIAAYYCFPENGKKNPAFVWSHGGGQRADRRRGHYYASQGFATIDINWLGRPLEADLDPENKWGTDWGAVDPSQGPRFYSKALRKGWKRSLQADEYTIDPIASPRNANWFLLAVAARRAITFLEEQAEVDPERLGFTGFSMGGTITSMTATDPRLKAVAPFVGGTGFLHMDFPGIPRSSIGTHFKNLDLYRKTIDPSAYWPSVKCPVMFITSSNDFHSAFQRIYRSMDLLPHDNWRVTGNMHANHGPGPEQWILLNHWFKQHLAAEDKSIPVTPPSGFDIENGVAHFSVTPVAQDRLAEVEIYYSYDPNCVTRFWKKALVKTDGKTWKADLNIHPKLPLYTFALCRYRLAQAEPLERGNTTSSFTLNSDLHTHIPEDIDLGAITRLPKTGLVDDFSNGILNWSSRDQSSIRTYKFQDPELDTSSERKLALTFNLKKDQPLLLGLGVDSKFLGNGRDLGSFNHGRRIEGDGPTTITLTPADFKNKDGKALEWSRITTFSISLTDQKTKQKIKLTDSNARQVLRRIELVEDAQKNAIPGGLSSKKGSGKIFPPNSKFLQVAGHDAYLALPEGVDAGQKTPWLWYCPSDYKLPGKLEQWMMKQCLDNGIAVAGIDVKGDFGTPAGRKIFTAFHKELTEKHGLTKKACMLARSYGGTQMYNWAAEHPESVACLAGIYPVCNLASYPGMKSAAGKYGMSQEEFAKELKSHNPIDRLAPLAKAKVPIYHNTGDVDTLVPPMDNSFLVEKRYKSLGGPMTVTIFEGQGHNYWTGFFEDQAMADFIIKHAKNQKNLPKVLIIGDSIFGGYSKALIDLLEGKAEVTKLGAVAGYRIQKETFWHSRGTAKYLDFGSAKACIVDFERFAKHLEDTPYDVIHFNFGLNDIFRGRNGAWHNPVDQYAKDLAKIVTLLKTHGAKVIWANITPDSRQCSS